MMPTQPSDTPRVDTTIDIEAVKWAIALLEKEPGVKLNTNSQYWLRRLRVLAGMNEDEICKADVSNFLDIYCDRSSPGTGRAGE